MMLNKDLIFAFIVGLILVFSFPWVLFGFEVHLKRMVDLELTLCKTALQTQNDAITANAAQARRELSAIQKREKIAVLDAKKYQQQVIKTLDAPVPADCVDAIRYGAIAGPTLGGGL